jgi:hypothetical protein
MKTWLAIVFTIGLCVACEVVSDLIDFNLSWITIFGMALWAAVDSSKIQLRRYRSWISYGPVFLFFLCVLFGIVVFPWYLSMRHKIKSGTAVLKDRAINVAAYESAGSTSRARMFDRRTIEYATAWWFRRGGVSVLTIPIFFLLLFGTIGAFVEGGIEAFAYCKATLAVLGWWALIPLSFICPFSLLMPGWIWWAAIITAPGIYAADEGTASRGERIWTVTGTIVLLVCSSMFMQWGHGKIIGWIADRNPGAAFRAGVTGSRSPSSP